MGKSTLSRPAETCITRVPLSVSPWKIIWFEDSPWDPAAACCLVYGWCIPDFGFPARSIAGAGSPRVWNAPGSRAPSLQFSGPVWHQLPQLWQHHLFFALRAGAVDFRDSGECFSVPAGDRLRRDGSLGHLQCHSGSIMEGSTTGHSVHVAVVEFVWCVPDTMDHPGTVFLTRRHGRPGRTTRDI